MAKWYEGEEIDVGFDTTLCIHSRNCALKLPDVFDPSRLPWVNPDAARAEEVAAMIRTCPSGALSFSRKDGGPGERPAGVNRVRITENGPIAVAGDIDVEGRSMRRATLCRCGASMNKPFCDFRHVEVGFEATGEPRPDTVEDENEERGGRLSIRRTENGPFEVVGNAELITGAGHRIARTETTFLCRCGHSRNKPFCDGSHARAGFRAEGATDETSS